jgi:signal peptidase I
MAPRLSSTFNLYVAQSVVWAALAGLVIWLQQLNARGSMLYSGIGLAPVAVMLGLFQVVCTFAAGFLAGFGRSPYSHEMPTILLNVLYFGSQLVGLELARWYVLTRVAPRFVAAFTGLGWLGAMLTVLPLSGITAVMGSAEGGLRYMGGIFLPAASEQMLATFLSLAGGPLAAIAYRGPLVAFHWLSPILPDLQWPFAAFLGTVVPLIGLLVARALPAWDRTAGAAPAREANALSPKWVILAVLALALLWLNTGLFGIRPALTSGISMEPTLKMGDLVFTTQIPDRAVQIGDVVRFKSGDGRMSILHRVIDIRDEGGKREFVTWGDNNDTPDEAWTADRLEGRLVAVLPKVGWIAIASRRVLSFLFGIGR